MHFFSASVAFFECPTHAFAPSFLFVLLHDLSSNNQHATCGHPYHFSKYFRASTLLHSGQLRTLLFCFFLQYILQHAGTDRVWRNPLTHKFLHCLHEVFAPQCCLFQQNCANPLRQANEGCQCCCLWKPDLPLAFEFQRQPIPYWSIRFPKVVVQSSLMPTPSRDLFRGADGIIQRQMHLPVEDWTAPCLQLSVSGFSDPSQRFQSFAVPNNPQDFYPPC